MSIIQVLLGMIKNIPIDINKQNLKNTLELVKA